MFGAWCVTCGGDVWRVVCDVWGDVRGVVCDVCGGGDVWGVV